MKVCTKCKLELPFTEFALDKQKSDGYYSSCKDCRRKRMGQKKRPFNKLGEYKGKFIVDGNPYPWMIGVGRKVRAHVYIMECVIGRKIKQDEVVHHINGDKKDFRIENLIIMSERTHHSYETKLFMKTSPWWIKRIAATVDTKCSGCGKPKKLWKTWVMNKYKGKNYKEKLRRALDVYKCKNCKFGHENTPLIC